MVDFSSGIQGKLLRSLDCGSTWDTLLVGGSYRSIVIDPVNQDLVYAISGSVVRSTDGGSTWAEMATGIRLDTETRVQCLALDKATPNTVYAGTGGFFGGTLYRSVNRGATWQKLLPDSLSDGVTCIAIDSNEPNRIYVGTAWRGLLLKTTNRGESWTTCGLGETGQLVHCILVDPSIPSTIYAGIGWIGLFRSEDSGHSWQDMNEGLPDGASAMRIVKNETSGSLFLVATVGDNGAVYQRRIHENRWTKIGIDSLKRSYYYSDLLVLSASNDVYFGNSGLHRIRIP
jgi:photosystem II stability/assembly factor-like uncharacterized protein